ncbi:MAG: metallophosphatase family protein [Gammaproteobacteria bacterium]|nr:metallophosphatase family protein [Gammaproteobacteria bacterium]MDH5651402.1 metallophosphatase family protein [Gammaproteobacteria bacterium]
MKIAVISDIHSNLEALDACCEKALREGAEQFVCLGDSVGYGPDPAAVLDKLRELPGFQCVLGNHDEYMFNFIGQESTGPVQMVAEWTVKQLSESHIDFLKSLTYVLVENGVTYVHASLYQPGSWFYITSAERAKKCLESAHTSLVFYGHVHIPLIFHEKADNDVVMINPEQDTPIYLKPNQRYVINVGSVGQPRDDNKDACFVLYDEDRHSVTFHRVAYDYQTTIRKINEKGLHPEFADRLAAGR